MKLALDAVPAHVNIKKVAEFLRSKEGVEEVHDLHIWAMSTTETALTAHLIMPGGQDDEFLYRLREELHEKFEIGHTTIQVENKWGDKEYQPYKE